MSLPSENIIAISEIGNFKVELLKPVRDRVGSTFQCDTEIVSIIEDAEFALDPARNQYYSTRILEMLDDKGPPRASKILAMTEVDLFIPILTHVYGEAQLGGRACIISTHRLREGLPPLNAEVTYQERIVKEALHELGHTYDLRHCPEKSCIMHYCRNESDVDRKSNDFCRYCKVLLDDALKKK